MIDQEIARLTGKLVWSADNSKLRAFQAALQRVSQQVAGVGKQFDVLQRKLNAKLGLKVGANKAQQTKLDKSIEQSLTRELRGEILLQKARRATMTADLAQRKLSLATTKETAYTASQELLAKRSQAILDAKQFKAEQERLKANGIELKQAQSLETHKTRQARLAEVLKQQQQRTILLQQKQVANMTAMQRAELSLNQARERGMRAAKKFTDQQAASRVQTERRDIAHDQRQQRFAWASQRHDAWAARQNQPESSIGFMGIGPAGLALGGIAAGLVGVVTAVNALGQRLEQRQTGVQDAEAFNNVFKSISPKEDIQQLLRERFIQSQSQNAGVINTETAKDFRVMVSGMLEAGKTLDQVMKVWETRQKTFAVAGTSADDNKELNKQLNQLASDGTGTKADADIINNRMPMIVPYVVRAFMQENKIADYQKGLVAYNKALKNGAGIRDSWYETAMANLVAQHQPDLERNKRSVTNAQRQNDNLKFLTETELNSDEELSAAMKDNVEAHRQMALAMLPVNQALLAFDTALVKVSTWMLNWFTDKDSESSSKKVDALSPDKSAIDPASFNGPKVDGEISPVQDPVDRLWNKWFGNAQPDIQKDQEAPKVDTDSDQWRPIIRELPKPLSAYDVAAAQTRAAQTAMSGMLKPDGTPAATTQEPVINNDNSTHTTVESPNISIAITAPAGLDERQVALLARKELELAFSKYMPSESH